MWTIISDLAIRLYFLPGEGGMIRIQIAYSHLLTSYTRNDEEQGESGANDLYFHWNICLEVTWGEVILEGVDDTRCRTDVMRSDFRLLLRIT